MKIEGKKTSRRIKIEDHTLWKKIDMAIFAYFSKHNNKPTTYREIARAYMSSSYTDYQKACLELVKRGYLERLKDDSFKVRESDWEMVRTGTEHVIRALPYFKTYLKKLKKRKKI